MTRKYHNYHYIFFCVFILISVHETLELNGWSEYLSDFIQAEKYNKLIILNTKNNKVEYKANNIIQAVSEVIPVKITNYNDLTSRIADNRIIGDSLESFQRLTFVLIIQQDLHELTDIFKWLEQTWGFKKRPKVLVILLEGKEDSYHQGLLQELWSLEFLEVTILESIEMRNKRRSIFIECSQQIIKIHTFNPFFNVYTKQNFDPGFPLFPDKLRDLNGYEIKIGVFLRPPLISFIRKDQNNTLKAYGIEARRSKFFSQAMNTRISWETTKDSQLKDENCNTKESTGIFYDVLHKRLDYIANSIMRYNFCIEKYIEWSVCFYHTEIIVVIPASAEETCGTPSVKWNIWKLLSFFFIIIIPWAASRILKFDHIRWHFFHLLYLFFGFSSPYVIQRVPERFLLSSILIINLFYSSYIFSSLAVISLTQLPKNNIRTLDDVISSNLTPVITHYFFNFIINHLEGDTYQFLMKSLPLNIDFDQCIEYMRKYQNISCVGKSDYLSNNYLLGNDEHEHQAIKVIDEKILKSINCLMMKSASQFVDRFDTLQLIAHDTGLIRKWYEDEMLILSKVKSNFEFAHSNQSSSSLILILYTIIFFGYLFATLVLLCELILPRIIRWRSFGYVLHPHGLWRKLFPESGIQDAL